ncbi:MAG TPA: DUF2238 domain-containing protein [Burkholderiales bacterium]|nr:DUF2238 domain-containing protein [Burkholderiales bacterium]
MPRKSEILTLLLVGAALLLWSGISPYDRLTWFMEVVPALIAAPLLVATWPRFPLTRLAYYLIFAHALVLMLGGHYTYARVPLGQWLEDGFGFTRNHYDRIGHLVQGFVPAIVARELLVRTSPLRPGKWLFALVTLTCLAISACYELIEWASAVTMGQNADEFLATPGRSVGHAGRHAVRADRRDRFANPAIEDS